MSPSASRHLVLSLAPRGRAAPGAMSMFGQPRRAPVRPTRWPRSEAAQRPIDIVHQLNKDCPAIVETTNRKNHFRSFNQRQRDFSQDHENTQLNEASCRRVARSAAAVSRESLTPERTGQSDMQRTYSASPWDRLTPFERSRTNGNFWRKAELRTKMLSKLVYGPVTARPKNKRPSPLSQSKRQEPQRKLPQSGAECGWR
jgi:hypothetical protein